MIRWYMMIENNLIELNLIEIVIEITKAKNKTKSQRVCSRKRKKKKKPNININTAIHIQTFDTHTSDDSDNNTSSLKIHSPSRNWNDWYNTIIERSKVFEKSNNNTSIENKISGSLSTVILSRDSTSEVNNQENIKDVFYL